jgi:hypothetical protein
MHKATKTLLGLAIFGITVGIFFVSGALKTDNAAFFVVLPTGAIFFGLFLISLVLEKETALFDEEQEECFALVTKPAAPATRGARKECSGHCGCEAKAAHAH